MSTGAAVPRSIPGVIVKPLGLLASIPLRLRRLTRSGVYQPELDGLRFIAIALVVLSHMFERAIRVAELSGPLSASDKSLVSYMPAAATGVTLFFTISGYILAAGYARQKAKGQPFKLGLYFQRRVSRLMPPYVVVLLAAYLVLTFTPFRPEMTQLKPVPSSLTLSLAASLVYVHGLAFGAFPRNFPPGWSLELEVQFYLVAPILFYLYFRQRDHVRRCVLGALAMVASVVVLDLYETFLAKDLWYYFTLLHWFHYFWLGVWLVDLVVVARTRVALAPRVWDLLGVAGLALMVYGGVLDTYVYQPHLVTAGGVLRIAAILMMFGGALFGDLVRRFCSVGWISLLGGACYSYYLVHLQIIQVISPVIGRVLHPHTVLAAYAWECMLALPCVMVGGFVFYYLIERPCMDPAWATKLLARFRTPRPVPVGDTGS